MREKKRIILAAVAFSVREVVATDNTDLISFTIFSAFISFDFFF